MSGLRRIAALGLGLAMIGGLSLVAATPATAVTPPTYSISGTVNVDNGDGVGVAADGATVTDVNNPAESTSTDAIGGFTLAGLADGDYTLEISLDGYATVTTDTTIAGGDVTLPEVVTLTAVTPADPEPSYYSITGTVTAKDGNSDFAATVEMNENQGYSNTVIPVDSSGNFSFENLEPNADVTLTFSADGYQTVTKDVDISAADAEVNVELLPNLPELKAGTAKITGTAEVGQVLTGSTTGWPAGTKLSYQWGFNGGQFGGPIDGATGTTLKLTKDLVGMQIVFIVTGTNDGFAPTSASAFGPHVAAAKKDAAAAPAGDSGGLAVYLEGRGVTAQSQTSAGLPAGDLNPGEDYEAELKWTATDSYVDVYLYSTPTLVGTFPVVNGAVQITLSAEVLSELEAGNHTLVVTGQSSGAVQAVALTVADMLAATGFNTGGPLAIAALLLLLGAALLVVRRRRVHA
ncbi:carboxypeptidase-like regulatory domain-containing protein [Cryobacterium tepidiphilum]|uniref:Carboxypeptidase regulatory-like domain-containing protein n=1 Tax=Cryobacterium tepidiphilum TaxID=2486026 RepID=A0A3M8LR93_9MICO|nr:carboxypeptidase-like regulatory domain-containing protein [Cryobacterium tepidiphilum]RNE67264.1 carboxypeptidase regulatory-like domain-containing protein [Cryobacterium tepidiphilum]